MEEAQNYTRWVIDQFRGEFGSSVLEIGIGHGGYSAHMPAGVRYWGLDLEASSVAEARKKYPQCEFFCADITAPDFVEKYAHLQPDSILCTNVIEHIEDDRLAVGNMLRLLAPGRRLLLLVPALPALYNDLDRLAGHYRRYTKARLLEAIPPEVGTVTKVRYFNSIGALGWYINKFKHYDNIETHTVSTQVRFFDRYVLPISRGVDKLIGGRFGQSLVAIVQKI